jgi:ankyrin repeat protein
MKVNRPILNRRVKANTQDNLEAFYNALVKMDYESVRRILKKKGAYVNYAICGNGANPLHYACENGTRKMIELLFEYKANPNLTDRHGKTPLHFAAENGKEWVIQILLDYKANPNLKED